MLLTEDGRAKLCDFGISHVHDTEDDSMEGLWGTWIYQVCYSTRVLCRAGSWCANHAFCEWMWSRVPSVLRPPHTLAVLQIVRCVCRA